MVGPTNRNPRRIRSRDIAVASGVVAGTSRGVRHRFCIGVPPTKDQRCRSRLPPSRSSSSTARAFAIGASIVSRLRTMPSSRRSRATSRAPKRATRAGSKRAKTWRYRGRFARIVRQLSPACAPSSTRNSNRVRSSCAGTPHSSSWYATSSGSLPAQPQRVTGTALGGGPGRDRGSTRVAEEPPEEDRREEEIARSGRERDAGELVEQPAREHDGEEARLAERAEANDRAVDARLAGEPAVRASEQRHQDRQRRGVDVRDRRGEAGEAADRFGEREPERAEQIEDEARPQRAPHHEVPIHGSV